MALPIPDDAEQLESQSLTDLARELPDTANPFLEESWMGAQAVANARRVFEFYQMLKILEREAVPITAKLLLETWAAVWRVFRNPATRSSGPVVATGSAGSVIPAGSELSTTNGSLYQTKVEATINSKVLNVSSMTAVGTTVTVVLASEANLFSGLEFVSAGANEAEYNGTFNITEVVDETTFKFEADSAPSGSPATGTITVTVVTAALQVQSIGFGSDQNAAANSPMTFSSPIAGVDSTAFVAFGAVGGASDQETLDELNERLLERIQNPVALFNAAAITDQAKEVPGVTDVFVFEITPGVGQVTIYFVRGNDTSPIPEASEVDTVKGKILEIKPAHMDDDDVIVSAPTPANAAFVFSSITPNNQSTRDAVTANLQALFSDDGEVGVAISEEQYNASIVNAGVTAYTLSSPSGDIGGGAGEYPVLDSVSFP